MAEIKLSYLLVDLTKGTSEVVDCTKEAKQFLGARGLWNKLAWDQIPGNQDAYDPGNLLQFGVGPLTGFIGDKTIMTFKSPLTGWAGVGTMSGNFGSEMSRAGYNCGLVVKGKAAKPSYIYINNDKVEIRDATNLWGKWRQEAEVTLKDALLKETGEMFGTAMIGPAGEKLVRYANIICESVHSASKWGCGGVMGSKNLKAVAVRGTRGEQVADPIALWAERKKYATHPATHLYKLGESRYGHTTSMPRLLRYAAEGIKNSHLSYDKIVEQSNCLDHQIKYMQWYDGCTGCATACFVPYIKRNERGTWVGEFRHDNVGNFNANVMMGYEEMAEFNALLNELGFDGEDLGGLVAWAMDLYENKIITKEDLGGIDLTWGNLENMIAFVKKIAARDGKAANAIADGYRRAYTVFGEKSKWYAFEFHGTSGGTYDPRNTELGRGLDYATSHNGARCHSGIAAGLTESASICQFSQTPFVTMYGSIDEAARVYLNAICGWSLTKQDLADIVLRNYYMGRAVSMKFGYNPAKDDGLCPRCFEETITDKYGKKWVWKKEDYEVQVKKFRKDTLKLNEDGTLPKKELQRLGIDFLVKDLEALKMTA